MICEKCGSEMDNTDFYIVDKGLYKGTYMDIYICPKCGHRQDIED